MSDDKKLTEEQLNNVSGGAIISGSNSNRVENNNEARDSMYDPDTEWILNGTNAPQHN